ncbi:tumor necrosis factor receptor superfamily member 4 isoform X2 [Chiroxiphia lanceolata]|uniref:tumor necrosis factor receptor superfamily member 4 isoform X2 n=1 Tax=Chiroxiphia lanceolata TaxID=296741 RepID=UPI0013CEFD92|nr:tumor necrosis factor receptor superfamily member 4 isoform X2 [Chiroxiphia lanceolata]
MARSGGNFPAVFLLLLVAVPNSWGLECREHQYPYRDKCCSDCAPGERMRNRCTATADTECIPCQDEYFSSEHHHSFCNSCTVCNTRSGSVEVKKCEKTSDRVCMCQAGFMPAGLPLGSVCSPCPEGTFSPGRNEKCQPWTNCSSLGQSTLRAGTEFQDAVCSSPVPLPEVPGTPTPAWSVLSTSHRDNRENNSSTAGISSPPRPGEGPSICPDPTDPTETNWGSLSLLLLCLILLMVSGMSILLLIIQAARKETKGRPRGSNNQKDGSCRIPIQEEQVDSNSSLIKN